MTTPTHISRRSLLGLAGLGAGALALGTAGCGGGQGASNPAAEIDIWCLKDTVQNKIQQAAIDRYNATAKGKAKITAYDNDPYKQKLRIAMGSPQQPDVFFNWGGASIRQYVQNNLLVDLTPLLVSDPAFKSRFLASVLDAGKIGDKYYGIPNRGMQPVILFYSQQALDKAKVSAPPTTWAELLSQVDKFKAAGITPFALAGSQPWTLLMWLEYLTDRIGGPAVFGNIAAGNKDGWRDPAVTQALNAIIDLGKRGGFDSNFASVGYDGDVGAGTLFAQGKAAMHLMGSWEYTAQLDQHPAFVKDALRWAAFPAFGGGKGNPTAVVGNPTNYFSVTRRSDNVDAAKQFLKVMASDAYIDDWIANGDVPAIAGIENKIAQSKNAQFGSFVYKMVQDASSFELSWDQAIDNKYAQPMLTNLQKVFLGQLDAKGFADAMVAIP